MTQSDEDAKKHTQEPVIKRQSVAAALKSEDASKTPRLVAAGRGNVAEQILALAFANGVKVREDPDLAEMLSAVDLDSEIPVEAFTAVAEILSYVYRANGDLAANESVSPEDWT